ncbi:MAG: hypothetical protein WA958_06275 [Tunicatimonas sp.]
MNLPLYALIASILSLMICPTAFAQQDSISVTYAEEPADSSSFSLKEKYKYFTRANVEETFMVKAGLSGIGYGSFVGLFLEHAFAVEKKLNVPFSVLAQYRMGMNGWRNNYVGVDIAARYYYSLPRRIRQGKSANNLSANYFSVQLDNTWEGSGNTLTGPGGLTYADGQALYSNRVLLVYGIQRRLGRHGYVDFNLGGSYWSRREFTYIGLGGNISIGFAF